MQPQRDDFSAKVQTSSFVRIKFLIKAGEGYRQNVKEIKLSDALSCF